MAEIACQSHVLSPVHDSSAHPGLSNRDPRHLPHIDIPWSKNEGNVNPWKWEKQKGNLLDRKNSFVLPFARLEGLNEQTFNCIGSHLNCDGAILMDLCDGARSFSSWVELVWLAGKLYCLISNGSVVGKPLAICFENFFVDKLLPLVS